MVLSTLALISFAFNLAFAPFFFTSGPFFFLTTELLSAMAFSVALSLVAGRAVSSMVELESTDKSAALRIIAMAALFLGALAGAACLFFSWTASELAYALGSFAELAGLVLYAFALPQAQRGFPGKLGGLLAAAASACSTYALAATSLVAMDPLVVALLRAFPAVCLALLLRRRESRGILLMAFAGVIVGIEAAELLGIRNDLSILFHAGLVVVSVILTTIGCLLPGLDKRKGEESKESDSEDPENNLSAEALAALGLSDGERRAVELTFKGLSSARVAVEMGVKAPTVRSYLQRSYRKAGVASFGGLKQLLAAAPPKEPLDKQTNLASRSSWTLASFVLLLSLVYFLPVGDYGLPASAVYAWIPIGLFALATFRSTPAKAISLIGLISSSMLGISFFVAALKPEMGWTPRWSMAVGLFSAGLVFWAAVFLGGWMQTTAGYGKERDARIPLAVIFAVAALAISRYSLLLRALLICVFAVACFVFSPRNAKALRRESKGGHAGRRGFARLASAFYLGAIVCDANMGYSLYFNYALAAACVLFLMVAKGLKLCRSLDIPWQKVAVVALVLGGVVVIVMREACVAALFAAALTVAVLTRRQENERGDARVDAIAFSCGIIACLCLGKFEFSLPVAMEIDFRGVMSLTVFKTLLFGAGAIIDGVALLLAVVWEDRAQEKPAPYDARVIQYLQARGLSRLEARILLGIARGDRAAVIARDNCCALGTVNSARHKAYGMLGVHSKDELAELLRKDLRTSTRV